MGIGWVGSVTGYQGGGTSFAASLPTGLANDDGVFALVMANSTLTAPAGWTQIATSACTGSAATQTLYLYRKDTVTSANSGTSVTWLQASNVAAGVTYFAVRAESGVVVVHSVESLQYNGGTYGAGEAIPAMTATFSTMVAVSAATTILSGGTYNPTAPVGLTKFTATSSTNYRLAAARATLAESDNITGTWTIYNDTANNGVNTMSILLRDQQEASTLAETLDVAPDIETGTVGTYGVEQVETLGLHDLLGILYQDSLLDDLVLTDTAAQILPLRDTIAENLQLLAPLAPGAWAKTAAETVGLGELVAPSPGVVLREGLRCASTVICNQKVGLLLSEALEAVDSIIAGRPLTVAETLDLAGAIQAARVVTVVQELGLAATLSPVATYHLSVTQGLGLATSLANFFGGDVLEGLGIAATTTQQMLLRELLEEGLGVEGVVVPHFILKATATDEIGLEAEDLLQQILSGQIAEGLELSGAYVGPDGSFTTWAMNTRTGAVSEYSNYEFNSFARFGNKYVGASSTGLYELLGDDDAGTDIIATLRGGYLQFAGTRLSRIKAAYIAMSGDTTVVLKIETKDGATYTYTTSTRDGRNTKVHMGKGQRSRYFAWELVTTGQDFDLDTLEFVPLRVERRV